VQRLQLPAFLGAYVVETTRPAVVAGLRAVVDGASSADWERLRAHLAVLGEGFETWEGDPLAARIAAAYMEPLLTPASTITGLAHLDRGLEAVASGRRLMIVGNHLSYTDTTVLGHLRVRAGRPEGRRRICAVAGPKVYSEPMRRVAAAGMNSIKVAQSARVATGQAALSRREIARIARRCLELAGQVMDAGQIVLIYPEGTRSRNGRLQPFLRATNRWLGLPDVLLPTAVWGTAAFDGGPMGPAECHARFGPPLDVGELGRGTLAVAHEALARLLPEPQRPDPACAPVR